MTRKWRSPIVFCYVFVVAVAYSRAEESGEPPVVQTQPVKASVKDLAWMAGSWHGEAFGGKCEEHWTKPAGDTLVGMFRLVGGDEKTRVSEYMIITQEGENVFLRFKHFNNDYTNWEKDVPLTFHCTKLTDKVVVFDSNEQTKPKRITYRLSDPGHLRVVVQSEENGEVTEGFTIDLAQTE